MAVRNYATTPKGIISGIGRVAPDIDIYVDWVEDPYFEWDGDGPDPKESGYLPHDVTVRAEIRADDRVLMGEDHLGSTYAKEYEQDPDIQGYFTGMLDQALEELYKQAARSRSKPSRKSWDPREESSEYHQYLQQIAAARVFVKRSMRAIYEVEERRRRRRG